MTTNEKQHLRTAEEIINKVVRESPVLSAMFTTRQPRYRYFGVKGSEDQPFWTIETVKHNGKMLYASGIYKYIKSKKALRLTKERYHSKRKDAKTRALKLWHDLQPKD